MINGLQVCEAIERARDKFLRKHPAFNTSSLKGRNHIPRTVFISHALDKIVAKFACNNLSEQLSGGYMMGYSTIYPSEFAEILSEEIGVPIDILVNNMDV